MTGLTAGELAVKEGFPQVLSQIRRLSRRHRSLSQMFSVEDLQLDATVAETAVSQEACQFCRSLSDIRIDERSLPTLITLKLVFVHAKVVMLLVLIIFEYLSQFASSN